MFKKTFLLMLAALAILPFAGQISAATQDVKSEDSVAWFPFFGGWGRGYGYGGYGYGGYGYGGYGYGCGSGCYSGCCGSYGYGYPYSSYGFGGCCY